SVGMTRKEKFLIAVIPSERERAGPLANKRRKSKNHVTVEGILGNQAPRDFLRSKARSAPLLGRNDK
ncbi:MAG: hypothetical protein ABFS17_11675, partial [Chloroflexota bacterium]